MQTPSEPSSHESCDGPCISASELIDIYYPEPNELGKFERVESDSVPPLYRNLLDHSNHMTVTVESYHGDSVDVEVLRSDIFDGHYRREILLRAHQSNQVVQYGLVRLCTRFLADKPRN